MKCPNCAAEFPFSEFLNELEHAEDRRQITVEQLRIIEKISSRPAVPDKRRNVNLICNLLRKGILTWEDVERCAEAG